MKACFGVVKYRLGSKPKLGTMPGVYFKTSDCSGFVRWLLYGASHGKVTLRTGSWYQHKWCDDEGFKKVKYSEVAKLKDSRLRIAFIRPEDGKIGHVWLVINDQTIEACAGRGACRRKWDTPILINNVDATYVLTDPLH